MIADGRVALNGTPIDTPATVLTSLDGVTVDNEPVAAAEPTRLFLFHKPPGVLTAERDFSGRPTIYDRLPEGLPRLIPVGRLDFNTEGLLLMTTDGGLKRQLELPATGVERAYRARAYGQVSQPQLEELMVGVEIEGIRYGPINANIERRTGANVWVEMILKEGKNREVRRVLEHLGLEVSRLIRTRYGPFALGDLKPGEIGEVRPHDVESFSADPTRADLPQPSRRQAIIPVAPPAGFTPKPQSPARPQRSEPAARPVRADRPDRPVRAERAVSPDRSERIARDTRPDRAERPDKRTGRPPSTKDEPRRRADGTLATRGTSGRTNRSRSFQETRPDDGRHERPSRSGSERSPAPYAGGSRPAGQRGTDLRTADRRDSNPGAFNPRAAGPRDARSGPPRSREDRPRTSGSGSSSPRGDDRRPSGSSGGFNPRAAGPRDGGSGNFKPRDDRPRGGSSGSFNPRANGPRSSGSGFSKSRDDRARGDDRRATEPAAFTPWAASPRDSAQGSPPPKSSGPRASGSRSSGSGSSNSGASGSRAPGGRFAGPGIGPRSGGPRSSGPGSSGSRPSGPRKPPARPRKDR